MGLEMGWFPLGNGVCLIINKAPSDSPIWQLLKRELLLPLSFLITKPIKLDLSNLHYRPHYEPHYRTQGCMIRENNITAPITNPIKDTLVPLRTNFNANGSVRWRTSVYLNLFHWPMGKNSGNRNGVCRYVGALSGSSKTAPRISIFSIAMGADYSFYVKSIASCAPTFFGYIISVLASVFHRYFQ